MNGVFTVEGKNTSCSNWIFDKNEELSQYRGYQKRR